MLCNNWIKTEFVLSILKHNPNHFSLHNCLPMTLCWNNILHADGLLNQRDAQQHFANLQLHLTTQGRLRSI